MGDTAMKRFMLVLISSVLISMIIGFARIASADLLINGSFETGNLNGWNYNGSVVAASDADYRDKAGGSGTWPVGTYIASFSDGGKPCNGVLSQSISTVTGSNYTLNFDYGTFGAIESPQSLIIKVINGADGSLINAIIVEGVPPTFVLNDVLKTYNMTFKAASDTSIISFADNSVLNSSSADGILDNVNLNANPVPLPSSLMLFGPVVFILLSIKRRMA
jgi:hypothetical protein